MVGEQVNVTEEDNWVSIDY